jgi:hypothetical protein
VAPWRAPSLPPKSAGSNAPGPHKPSPGEPAAGWTDRLGRKVSLRYRLHGDPAHPFSDAVGVVASLRLEGPSEIVTIIDRRGRSVEVPVPDVLAVKVFPL